MSHFAERFSPAGPPSGAVVPPEVPDRAPREGRRRERVRRLVIPLVALAVVLGGGVGYGFVRAGSQQAADEQLAQARAAVGQVVADGGEAQAGLAAQVATAEEVLAASQGKVADDAVRAGLADQVAAAKAAGAAPPPAVADHATLAEAEAVSAAATEWVATLREAAEALAAGTEAVRAAQAAWESAQAEAAAAAERESQAAAELPAATATLEHVTHQLEISVRDSGFTIEWTQGDGAPTSALDALTAHRAEGQAVLAAAVDLADLASVQAAAERRETVRVAIEAAAWDARATVADGTNGKLAIEDLCPTGVSPEGQDQYLGCDAAAAWERLGAEFQAEFGKALRVEYGYRPYDWQLQVLDEFGAGLAGQPGTSNHGWAAAADVPVDDGFRFGQPEFAWLAANGPRHGWVHPYWARQGGGREESWHFEYVG
ncbi:M15 family metallopeptidase [Antribacter sp. KLBMP9083]|uniref:M15 family metallopeptidase n=1 Tax=Antribacter soli TaxID=2910976 RepID=A0AA41QI88_9MICO|nr:M15 family metallopeptidase [Antribacter soli]MCF4122604.1 M15 family metallopeptidase [Antribacter soli]